MPALWDASRLGWLALASFEGFGSRTLHKLYRRFGDDGGAALLVPRSDLVAMRVNEAVIDRFTEYRRMTNPTDLALRLDQTNIRFLLRTEDEYPPLLLQIADPPFALFVRGSPIPHDADLIAIVGTRAATPYGTRVAGILGRELAQAGIGIVSGLALGIDGTAHAATLDAGGYCLAVLGGGIDDATLYPRSHVALAGRILTAGGTLVSELPPGTEAMKHHFPLRNRIISGVSRATVVVEATQKSGSLITAHQALEQNREVFAVPGPITSEQSRGTNKLIRQGAVPCTGTSDILETLPNARRCQPAVAPNVDADERELLTTLEYPLHIDDIARRLACDLPTVSSRLLQLELKGLVTAQGGKIFERSMVWNAMKEESDD
jgi:DNA processing protein